MPNTLSADKALRQSRKRHAQNSHNKEQIKAVIKTLRTKATNPDILEIEYSKLQSLLDKASKNNILHKNKVARLKARLYKTAHVSGNTSKPTKSAKVSKS